MRRRLPTATALIAAGLICQGCLELSGARFRTSTQPSADPRWFARSCDALWPEAARLLNSEGFRLVGKDPAGTIASFIWADERRLARLRATGDLREFIAAEDGVTGDVRSVRVESAMLETVPKNRGCEVRLRISYTAPRGSLGWKRGWVKLSSSGKFEARLLAMLNSLNRGGQRTASSARAPARTAPSAVARLAPQEPSLERRDAFGSQETRVLRLEAEN